MSLKLMYITNDVRVAKIGEECGVDWIFIDLEVRGKAERQGHLDTVISYHSFDDVGKIRSVLKRAELLVRVNPFWEGTEDEVERVIGDGADIIMLPFFRRVEEVEEFLGFVRGRVKVCLLVETPEAGDCLEDILELGNIDYVHIGLNDYHLCMGMKFMFELLADGTVDALCEKMKGRVVYGFGGIARLGHGTLPAEYIIGEHYRLGSQMAILSRSFCNIRFMKDLGEVRELFCEEIKRIRDYERELGEKDSAFFEENRKRVRKIVGENLIYL